MQKKKWRKYKQISITRYGCKLAEECGEVCAEVGDYVEKDSGALARMIEELDHVIFIAQEMQNRAKLEVRNVSQ